MIKNVINGNGYHWHADNTHGTPAYRKPPDIFRGDAQADFHAFASSEFEHDNSAGS